jgi:hypothetical protein
MTEQQRDVSQWLATAHLLLFVLRTQIEHNAKPKRAEPVDNASAAYTAKARLLH